MGTLATPTSSPGGIIHFDFLSTHVPVFDASGYVQCYIPKQVKQVDTPSQNSKETKFFKQEVKAPSAPLELKAVPTQPGLDSSAKTKDNGEWSYLQMWDGWPDGDFELDVDHTMFEATQPILEKQHRQT
ncbi:hypothetical protein DFS33DRAFT_1276290 [Desarmillaria ectypa]|nr:hypothetical protein DFS33DRAFT_1276290 [Desarmillaria ectypa]